MRWGAPLRRAVTTVTAVVVMTTVTAVTAVVVVTMTAEAVERRRRDPAFTDHVRRIIEQDRELLERLAK